MTFTNLHHPRLQAHEAFIRRAAELEMPFMLKGSYVTRQYFANPLDREPQDLDWVYVGGRIGSETEARAIFDQWATYVTALQNLDGAVFESFLKNAFWRRIDYSMADDFPTVNTDLACWLHYADGTSQRVPFDLDVSFNLPMDVPSEPLYYTPLEGEPFIVPHATPLALQVAWKLHQTLVRPRFKDLFDLLHLLPHPDFTPAVRELALAALAQECRADGTDPARLNYLLAGDLGLLFSQHNAPETWRYWRHRHGFVRYSDQAWHITDPDNLPDTLADFTRQLCDALAAAGFEPLAPADARIRKAVSERKRGYLNERLSFLD